MSVNLRIQMPTGREESYSHAQVAIRFARP
jgi:hypothetical protein